MFQYSTRMCIAWAIKKKNIAIFFLDTQYNMIFLNVSLLSAIQGGRNDNYAWGKVYIFNKCGILEWHIAFLKI